MSSSEESNIPYIHKARSEIVNVTIPARVLNNLEEFQKVQKIVLGELGCVACCSGYDIRYTMVTDFVFGSDNKLYSRKQLSA